MLIPDILDGRTEAPCTRLWSASNRTSRLAHAHLNTRRIRYHQPEQTQMMTLTAAQDDQLMTAFY